MSLPKKFESYLLESLRVSGKTLRDYRADLSHFSGWAILYLKSQGVIIENFDSVVPYFSSQLIAGYKGYHLENGIPESTINRRLSTLRNLARFLILAGLIQNDPTRIVSNLRKELADEEKITILIEDFKKHLEKEGISRITLKNYISDIRHFLAWSPKEAICPPCTSTVRGSRH